MGVSRRVFFVGSAVLATGIVVRPMRALARLTNEERAPGPIRLGMASYTFREFTRLQLIQYMKDLNLSALNAKDAKDHLPMESTAEAQALADYTAAGIRLHAAGVVSLAVDTDEDMRAKFDYIRRAGVGVMVAGDPTPASLPRIERFAKEYDIRVAIHNHGPEDKLWPSPLDVLKAVEGMDRRLGCCIDVGHTVRAGTDVVEAIHAAGSRLFNMHMKDLKDFHDKASQVAVGDGQMPVPAIFAALEEIRYPGYVDLEYEVHADDPMPGVTKSFAYMRGVLAGMSRGAA
jgi:sugar phosphate isomerase/epimerase